MKQILQNLSNGETLLVDVPCPKNLPGYLLIATRNTIVSTGTERMLVNFGKANLIDKARQQPDKVKLVVDKIKTDGLLPTIEAVRTKLDKPIALGYSSTGMILEVGKGVEGFSVGDRVVSNGPHAEIVRVPKNLCAKIPDSVSDETAAFTVVGAIALQGIRLIQPTLGETIVVTGLGLIGQLAVQLLRAHGCRVLGIDFDSSKCDLARSCGAQTVDLSKGEDALAAAEAFSRGRGVDGVIIAASTESNQPVHQAALMCRKRGRIVLVGVTGLKLSRDDFFKKELSFQVSTSYGPGRYDPLYEESGQDYPIGFVRWTEQRNFEAILDTMAENKINVKPLISHRFPFERALEAYALLRNGDFSLGVLLGYTYDHQVTTDSLLRDRVKYLSNSTKLDRKFKADYPIVGFLGAGNYASRVLIPAFKEAGARLKGVVTSGGVNAIYNSVKHGISLATTDAERVILDPEINTIVVATQHNTHAQFVSQALKVGKHVFVEKPLALTLEELKMIANTYQEANLNGLFPILMVGFNRRYAPQVQRIKTLLNQVSLPKIFIMTINAGEIPPEHWTQKPEVGGGRIIGEVCHFVDLMRFLAGAPIEGFEVTMIGDVPGITIRDDKVSITLKFKDGSLGTIHYLANGSKSFPKERLEVFCASRVLQLDNFRKLKGFGWPGFKRLNLWRQDKGQKACVRAFIQAVQQSQCAPIAFDELLEVSQITIEIANLR